MSESKIVINPSVRALADALAKYVSGDVHKTETKKDKDKVIIGKTDILATDPKAFELTLPEGMELATVLQVQDHLSNVTCAATLLNGEVGVAHLTKNKDLMGVGLSFKAGRDKIESGIARTAEVGKAGGEKNTRYGWGVSRHLVGGNKNKGELKRCRHFVSALAKEALS